MEIKLTANLILTTDSPASSYSTPVLRHLGCDCGDYGPGDPVPDCMASMAEFHPPKNAADLVCQTTGAITDTATRDALDTWLRQLAGGPYIEDMSDLGRGQYWAIQSAPTCAPEIDIEEDGYGTATIRCAARRHIPAN